MPQILSSLIMNLAALIIGLAGGWMLHIVILNRRASRLKSNVKQKREALTALQSELGSLSDNLFAQTKLLSTTRDHLDTRSAEHSRLVETLDERQSAVRDAKGKLNTLDGDLQSRQQEAEAILGRVQSTIDELDTLNELQENYGTRIDRLAQQVQWQDSEVRMLRQSTHAKTSELNEARALLDQHDAELRRIIRQRQQREVDIVNAKRDLGEKDEELRGLLGSNREEPVRVVESRSESPSHLALPPAPIRIPIPAKASQAKIDWTLDDHMIDDLTQIEGIVERYAERLITEGITSFGKLGRMSPAELDRILEIPGHYSPDIPGWIEQARRLYLDRHGLG